MLLDDAVDVNTLKGTCYVMTFPGAYNSPVKGIASQGCFDQGYEDDTKPRNL
jgi:hypothetical protein